MERERRKPQREGRKPQREGRKPEREGRKPQREGKGRGFTPRRLIAMGRVGRDKSRMKYSDRYPRLIIRIGDELLGEMEKEIKKSGMNSSEITKKALSEYFERSTVEN